MGDEPDYEENLELQDESEKLKKMIEEFDKIQYPID